MARAMSQTTACVAFCVLANTPPTRADEIASDPRPPASITTPNTLPVTLDDSDAVAALNGISIALTEVGDGGSYVWRRIDGQLSGMAQPTTSFRGASGQPCRHLIVMLNAADHSAKIEGTACRTAAGQWHLHG